MTALVARQPLHPLSMSSTQRPARRLSTRLRGKDTDQGTEDGSPPSQPLKPSHTSRDGSNAYGEHAENRKKRKIGYDEEDDGFTFTRVKKKKQHERPQQPEATQDESSSAQLVASNQQQEQQAPTVNGGTVQAAKKQRTRMSFSTPNPKQTQNVRRSKRLSAENQEEGASSPPLKTKRAEDQTKSRQAPPKHVSSEKPTKPNRTPQPIVVSGATVQDTEQDSAATKIALPFADTPVIRRNKAMRENQSGKGERRSSLSLRGRRASSLIESGSSNALPHEEVQIPDFYKHIEADGLPEPRRMRLLLTWCATRFLDQKPFGADFEDSSSISAARVIQEELLKDLGNRSELSDWFHREDLPVPSKDIPERPNPKNLQNADKITELEEQIKKLQGERDALEALLRPPAPLEISMTSQALDKSFLSEEEAAIFDSLHAGDNIQSNTTRRLNAIQSSLGTSVDAFADGVHKIGQFRNAAENLAGRALATCSERFAEKERQGRKQALQEEDRSPSRDLGSVLRGLSRVDR